MGATGSTPDAIAGILRRLILQGDLRPGQWVNQTELAAHIGVSRIPLREALRTLAAEGLVAMQTGRGAMVTQIEVKDALDLYDLRLALEPPLADGIAEYAGPRDVERLRNLASAMAACETHDRERYSDLNLEFHTAMYHIADKPAYVRLVGIALGTVEPYSRMYLHLLGGLGRAQNEHFGMVSAIEERDGGRLADLIRQHLVGARQALVNALPRLDGRESPNYVVPSQGESANNTKEVGSA